MVYPILRNLRLFCEKSILRARSGKESLPDPAMIDRAEPGVSGPFPSFPSEASFTLAAYSRAASGSTILQRARPLFGAVAAACLLLGCDAPVNSPRPGTTGAENTLYSPFSGRSPKTLDPAVSYSTDETAYTYSIYEAPYQYHYLKRPYEVVPRTAEAVLAPEYYDAKGRRLPENAAPGAIAESRYVIPIRKGILFAPHPCFAKGADGSLLYANLAEEKAASLRSPLELPERGTRELTAEDYVYAVKRIASPRVVSPAFSVLSDHIMGLREMRAAITKAAKAKERAFGKKPAFLDLREIAFPEDGVRALDPHTLQIRVKGKYPQFKNWLAMAFFAPIPWEAERFYANPGFARSSIGLAWWPVGTGPFMMERFEENRLHSMVRNPNFRGDPYPCEGEAGDREAGLLADCGKPTPFVDRVVFSIEKEAIPLRTKFLQGYYDSPAIDRSDVGQGFLVEAADSPEKSREYREKKIRFPRSFDLSSMYLGFNMLDPVVGKGKTPEEEARHRALRQALSIAIDWEEAVSIFQKDQARPLMGPLPPGLWGAAKPNASEINPVVYRLKDGKPERRSLAEARALMARAGYPGGRDAKTGRPLVLAFDYQQSASGAKSLLDWYQKQFAKLGIQLEIRATDYNRFQDKMIRGAAQIFFWGWVADYPDAENFLFLLYGPNAKALTRGSGENAANYVSKDYDRLFDAMRYEDDGPEKDRLVNEMVSLLQQDAPWSFGYTQNSAAAYHEWVLNAKPSSMIRNSLQYLRLDTSLREQRIREWNRPVWWPLGILAFAAALGIASAARLAKKRSRRTARGEQHDDGGRAS